MAESSQNLLKSFLSPHVISFSNAVVRRARVLPGIMDWEFQITPRLGAKMYPHAPTESEYVLRKLPDTMPRDEFGLPVPPQNLWMSYGKTADIYLDSGKHDIQVMRTLLEEAGFRFTPGQRVLEWGCAAARMLRWLYPYSRESEIWGVDISAAHIAWCADFLSPPFQFVTTTTFPHLPFEDRSFDLIFAGSVMTHIFDLAEMWLLELKRILRPGGFLYVTIHDSQMVQDMLAGKEDYGSGIRDQVVAFEARAGLSRERFETAVLRRVSGADQVFYDTAYVQERWGRWFDVRAFVPRAYGFQAAVLLQRRV